MMMILGPSCFHKSRYPVIKLGNHNTIQGPPFLSHMAARVEVDDCWIPTRHGPVALPQWVSRDSRREIDEEMQRKEAVGKEGEVYLLIPQRQLSD